MEAWEFREEFEGCSACIANLTGSQCRRCKNRQVKKIAQLVKRLVMSAAVSFAFRHLST
jgi:hypothetical protein